MFVRQIYDEGLSQYAYLIGCQQTGEALVIDPERDVDRYLAAAAAEGLRVTAVAETHIHADFVSGARELADRGAIAYLSAAGDADNAYAWPVNDRHIVRGLGDGDCFRVGHIELRAVHTPGHTPEHLSFFVTDRGGGADTPIAVASGDFVFVGDVGRPDLLESAVGIAGAMRPAAERLGESLRTFAGARDELQIWPGHGAGSACGKALGAVPISTLGYERRFNAAFRLALEQPAAFPDAILDDQPEPPLYFSAMKRLNRVGPPVLGALPRPPALTSRELADIAAHRDIVILDTRTSRTGFMDAHVPGAIFAPLDRQFSTVVGSLVDTGARLALLAGEAAVEPAVRQLVRIGVDRIVGHATPDCAGQLPQAAIRHFGFAALRALQEAGTTVILDVRRASEFRAGHLPGAINIPHTRLLTRLDELPRDRPIAVHCASGRRAAVAAAALARAGYDVALVDGPFTDAAA